jgi:hypothetical protein
LSEFKVSSVSNSAQEEHGKLPEYVPAQSNEISDVCISGTMVSLFVFAVLQETKIRANKDATRIDFMFILFLF